MALPEFQYTPLNLNEPTFRLAILEAGTEEEIVVKVIEAIFKEDDRIEYDAVSYLWGSEEKPKVIRVGDSWLPVTCNLWHMLHDLRYPSKEHFLWIDAICINQVDDMERNHQVARMGVIYNRADKVIFYLGPSTDGTRDLMHALIALQKQCNDRFWESKDPRWDNAWEIALFGLAVHKRDGGEKQIEERLRRNLKVVLSWRWFRRVWILQEIANAKSGWVYCGVEFIPARFFAVFPRLLGLEPDRYQQTVLDMMSLKPRSESKWRSQQDLYDLLQRFAEAEAKEEHDKIFALLGMCIGGKGNGTLTADYRKETDDVIREAITFMCFCDPEDVPAWLCASVETFFKEIETLHMSLLKEFVMNSRLKSLQSMVAERSKYVLVTQEVAQIALSRKAEGPEILDFLGKDLCEQISRNTSNVTWYNIPSVLPPAQPVDSPDTEHQRAQSTDIPGAQHQPAKPTDTVEIQATPETVEALPPLLLAVKQGKLKEVQELLDSGTSTELRDDHGLTSLLWAARKGYSDITLELVKRGVDIEARDHNGATALLLAACSGHADIVEFLIDSGAEIDVTDRFGGTAWLWTSSHGYVTLKEFSLDRGARFRTRHDRQPHRVHPTYNVHAETQPKVVEDALRLLLAVKEGNQDAVQNLLQLPMFSQDIAIEARDDEGMTPLLWAARNGHLNIARMLLRRGANIEANNHAGHTALAVAARNDHYAVTKLLVDCGANLDAEDLKGDTPIDWALWEARSPFVRLFLEERSKRMRGPRQSVEQVAIRVR